MSVSGAEREELNAAGSCIAIEFLGSQGSRKKCNNKSENEIWNCNVPKRMLLHISADVHISYFIFPIRTFSFGADAGAGLWCNWSYERNWILKFALAQTRWKTETQPEQQKKITKTKATTEWTDKSWPTTRNNNRNSTSMTARGERARGRGSWKWNLLNSIPRNKLSQKIQTTNTHTHSHNQIKQLGHAILWQDVGSLFSKPPAPGTPTPQLTSPFCHLVPSHATQTDIKITKNK